MTDGRVRLRERDRRAGLDPGAEVRHLAERLRTGTLTRERLRLAAYCGNEAAGSVLGIVVRRCADCGAEEEAFASTCSPCLGPDRRCPEHHEEDCPNSPCGSTEACGNCGSCDHVDGAEWVAALPPVPGKLDDWLRGLLEHDGAGPAAGWVLARAARAVLDLALRAGSREVRRGTYGWITRAGNAMDAWLACPCDGHRKAFDLPTPENVRPQPIGLCAHRMCMIVLTVGAKRGPERADALVGCADAFIASRVWRAANSTLDDAEVGKAHSDAVADVKAAIRSALSEWALR